MRNVKSIAAAAAAWTSRSSTMGRTSGDWGFSARPVRCRESGRRAASAGAASKHLFWIDPARGVAGVILMQFLPFANAKALAIYDTFERGVYQLADSSLKSSR
jgi:hypothetical protein